MMKTLADVDAASRARARKSTVRITVVAAFVLLIFLILAGLIEREQRRMQETIDRQDQFVRQMCEQRKAATNSINQTWETLAKIDSKNSSLPPEIKKERLDIYAKAKLPLPNCEK